VSNFGHILAGVIDQAIVADQDYIDSLSTANEWVELPFGVGIGWNYDGTDFTDSEGNPPPTPPEDVPQYRFILSGTEWVERYYETEWAWLKVQRATVDRLDQMMDAIRWTNSIDVSSPNMDEFYNWLLNNGLPGGQARVDELRAGILL
jgi:hypothetical protein